jgi:polyisoprenoid-binding protein YceI
VGPVEAGVVRAERFDAATRSEIERAVHSHILDTRRHPTARFTGTALPTDSGFDVSGKLELVGRSEPLSFAVRRAGTEFRADFEFSPSHWGIEPYRALFGAIRLQDRLSIAVAMRENV